MPRIALYSHDTFGLGHLRRCLKLADHVRRHFGTVEGLLLTGSPWYHLFPLPAGFSVTGLPPVVKTSGGRYTSRHPGVDFEGLLDARRDRITASLGEFRPDLFVVDNVPCGLRGEVLPALEVVRAAGGRTVLALRDVLDDLESVRAQWEKAGAYEAVSELFDEIWVFGDAADTAPLIEDGPLSGVATKVHSCGRIAHLPTSAPVATSEHDGRPVVLVTGGGGRDASPLMRTYLDAVTAYRPLVTSHLVLGPDFPVADRDSVTPPADQGVDVVGFVPDLPRRLEQSNVIVSMAGYNTVCEILASGRPAVLVPRVTPRQEQLLRALRWQKLGRTRMIDPAELSPEALWSAVESLLDSPREARPSMRGGFVAAERAAALLGVGVGGAAS